MTRKQRLILPIIFLVGALCSSIIAQTACTTTATYNSIDAVTTAAQTAVATFKDMRDLGLKSTDPTVVKLWKDRDTLTKAAYEKFQAAAKLAVDVTEKAGQKGNGLAIVNAALADLIPLLQSFGVKI